MSRINWPSVPSDWIETQLGQVAQVVMGQSPPGHTYNNQGQGLPFFQGKTDFGEVHPTPVAWCTAPTRVANAGDILISIRAPVGPTNIALERCCIGRGLAAVRTNPDLLDRDFLLQYFRFGEQALASLGQGSTFEAVNKRELFGLRVSVPPLPEQQRIVEILKRADDLRRQRREILDQAKQIPAALFLEMFGDADTRVNKRWEIATLGKTAQVETGGTPSRTSSEFYKGEIAWVKSTELLDGRIHRTEETISEEALKSSNTKLFPAGTVLLAMYGQGQTRGRTGLLEIRATCNQACAAILPNDELLPEFIFVWLQCSYDRVRALGRGGQQANINLNIVRSLKIPKPPIILQEKFREALLAIEEIQAESNRIVKKYEELLKQVVSASFTGELTKEWREGHRTELEIWLREHAEQLPKKTTRISFTETAPPERAAPSRPARHWVMEQLSAVQERVHRALEEWKGTLIPAEDLGRFLEEWPIEDLEEAHDQVLRALNQLAGLGLIARVSIPNQMGEYVSGYRVLREDELSKFDDERRLGAPA